MEVEITFEKFALGVEAAAIAVIVVGFLIATGHYIFRLLRRQSATETFRSYRHALGRTLLLSLEFLVAADIIRTVVIDEPTFGNIGVLGLLILVRTLLSWTLDLELNGRWPWQKMGRSAETSGGST